jgi:hypothetical protein
VTALEFRLNDLASVLGGVVLCPRPLAFDPFRQYRDLPLTAPDELTAYAALLVKGLSYFFRRLDDGISDGDEPFCVLPFRASALGSVLAHPAMVTSSSLRPSPYCMFQY